MSSSVRWPQPDFMPAPQRPGVVMWLWLGISVAVLGVMLWQVRAQRIEAGSLDDQALVLQRLADRAAKPPAAVQPAGLVAAQTAASGDLLRRAWAVSDQLDVDWRQRWLALEQALPSGLQLQALEIEGQALRIEGLAQDMQPVTELVDRLSVQSPDLSGTEIVMTRLQRPEAADAAAALRFEIVRRRAGDGRRGDGA